MRHAVDSINNHANLYGPVFAAHQAFTRRFVPNFIFSNNPDEDARIFENIDEALLRYQEAVATNDAGLALRYILWAGHACAYLNLVANEQPYLAVISLADSPGQIIDLTPVMHRHAQTRLRRDIKPSSSSGSSKRKRSEA